MSAADNKLTYKRVLLKISGEALMGEQDFGIDPVIVKRVSEEIAEVVNAGVEVGLVVGGGNIFRGVSLTFDEVLDKKLGVMDLTAIVLCRDHNMPLKVFDMNKAGALMRVMRGEDEGTLVERGDE